MSTDDDSPLALLPDPGSVASTPSFPESPPQSPNGKPSLPPAMYAFQLIYLINSFASYFRHRFRHYHQRLIVCGVAARIPIRYALNISTFSLVSRSTNEVSVLTAFRYRLCSRPHAHTRNRLQSLPGLCIPRRSSLPSTIHIKRLGITRKYR